MKAAYLDTSCLLAIAFSEPGHEQIRSRIEGFDQVFSSNLLEAELRAAIEREQVVGPPEEMLLGIEWVLPDRPLTPEYSEVLSQGYLRGADLWHLACALLLRRKLKALHFVSLDRRQLDVAQQVGLRA